MKNPIIVLKLLSAGAAGYLSKEHGFKNLDRAIRAVHLGQRYLSSDMANIIALRKVDSSKSTPFDDLSPRELEVAILLVNAKTPVEISKRMHITVKTVHSNRYRIHEKLGIKNDLELQRLAIQLGVVELDKIPPNAELDNR